MIDRAVEQIEQRHLLELAQVLAHPVEDDDGVVDGIAGDHQDRRQGREIELDLGQRIEADGRDDVVQKRDQGGDTELPFEAEPDVDADHQQRQSGGERAVTFQLAAHLRTDEFGAPVLHDPVPERVLDHRNGLYLLGLLAVLALQVDQHVVGLAEFLQRHFAEPKPAQQAAHLSEVGRAVGLDLHQDAAAEVDAEVEALDQEQRHRGEHQRRRKRQEQLAPSHEGQVRSHGDMFDQGHGARLKSAGFEAAGGAAKG